MLGPDVMSESFLYVVDWRLEINLVECAMAIGTFRHLSSP
jgi:hypothetical protein